MIASAAEHLARSLSTSGITHFTATLASMTTVIGHGLRGSTSCCRCGGARRASSERSSLFEKGGVFEAGHLDQDGAQLAFLRDPPDAADVSPPG
jgi:hypothetical protein